MATGVQSPSSPGQAALLLCGEAGHLLHGLGLAAPPGTVGRGMMDSPGPDSSLVPWLEEREAQPPALLWPFVPKAER